MNENDMVIAHLARKSDREAPLRDAERSDIRAHMYGVDRDGWTMGQLLRAAPTASPSVLPRLVALTVLTYGGKVTPAALKQEPAPPKRAAYVAPALSRLPRHLRERLSDPLDDMCHYQ